MPTYMYQGEPDGFAYMTALYVPVSLFWSRSTMRAWLASAVLTTLVALRP